MIDIEPVGDHYETYAFLCRGHVEPGPFVQAFVEQWGCLRTVPASSQVKHIHARLVPCRDHPDYDLRYIWPVKPGRGAFKVTIWEVTHAGH